MPVACYPCSVYGHACTHGRDGSSLPRRVLVSHASAQPRHRCFDVALWRRFPSLWPEWTGQLEAEDAFSAVVQLMHGYGLSTVAYAAAIALDGSIAYRAYEVRGVKRGLVWFAGRRDADSAVPDGRKSVEM